MPRFRVRMERPVMEFREVCVKADDIDDAKVRALSSEFDEHLLDDWDIGDPGDAEVYDVIEADDDEPLTPIAHVHLADERCGLPACGRLGPVATTKHREQVSCPDCRARL